MMEILPLLAANAHPLVHLNVALNLLATILLLVGYRLVKQRRLVAHARTMIAAFGVSSLFLISYLIYHYKVGHVEFGGTGFVRVVYLAILLPHIILAVTVPFLAVPTILFGLMGTGVRGAANLPEETRARFLARHRKLARLTFPIWMYVSVTGVIVYVMLYHLWPSAAPLAFSGGVT